MNETNLTSEIKELVIKHLGRKGVKGEPLRIDTSCGTLRIGLWDQDTYLGHWSGAFSALDALLDRMKAKENK